jgi:hypothetical protein
MEFEWFTSLLLEEHYDKRIRLKLLWSQQINLKNKIEKKQIIFRTVFPMVNKLSRHMVDIKNIKIKVLKIKSTMWEVKTTQDVINRWEERVF